MNIPDEIEQTEAAVRAALDEVSMAVMFHETWKPTAYDANLHARMGNSYATHAFQIIRASLRREMLLCLMRLWESIKSKETLRASKIIENLRDKAFFEALCNKRRGEFRDFHESIEGAFIQRLRCKRDEAIALGRKYQEGGAGFAVLKKIQTLRHQRLAHRQFSSTTTSEADATDQDIETFYQDSLEFVRLSMSLVLATAVDFQETADVYRNHANFFWVNARGERTEGHPNYHEI